MQIRQGKKKRAANGRERGLARRSAGWGRASGGGGYYCGTRKEKEELHDRLKEVRRKGGDAD